ncbi:class I SAM-dependent methyltransferase [Tellurirhabdus bombi]|uniref:class I SAM-dependent methyltransferase n=1 Tax=Tellurirhabdus bombi TaxID=2907205 RepID=UPI001F20D83D|nr:class I SAM-dependent methyltransferase [Tellurirhabdus bombi]
MIFLTPEEQEFIIHHMNDDPATLLLRQKTNSGLRMREIAAQLTARQKARQKLPAWYANPALVFPPPLSVEQASSERTALYKASLVGKSDPLPDNPTLLIDLTGGMGVDTAAFSERVDQVIYVENQANLAELATYNLPRLGASGIEFRSDNGLHFLQNFAGYADWIYLDPARRDSRGGKVVRLEDCEPPVADWYDTLLAKAQRLLIKTSPLIDIESSLRTLKGVSDVHVVAVDNECKEVLFVVSKEAADDVLMTAVNLRSKAVDEHFSFVRSAEKQVDILFGPPDRYLYEPNSSILKAGAFRVIADRFKLTKIAPNSHLYTSDKVVDGFPGRIFEVIGTCKPDRKAVRMLVPDRKANLTIRNFPDSVDALRKTLELTDGGETYIFATTLLDGTKRLLITNKLVN